MKKTVRFGMFETNSSSTHCMTMCSQEEYDSWKNGDIIYDRDYDRFVDIAEMDKDDEEADWRYLTYDDVFDWRNGKISMETFEAAYTTSKGETVVAFGWYGYE